eukprot:TRINITY_DN2829_c2_g1_i5.p1 TRINITY_DN2829_c2_g1~~TRINITY_DN2829_c2_g1_i5.p1  ORF type:complete len:112 (+),score=12.18 TRINITY_DN2829_c2_g1_i5:166-501(+)
MSVNLSSFSTAAEFAKSFKGEWEGGRPNGLGVCLLQINGNHYQGEWEDGKPHGLGFYQFQTLTMGGFHGNTYVTLSLSLARSLSLSYSTAMPTHLCPYYLMPQPLKIARSQ